MASFALLLVLGSLAAVGAAFGGGVNGSTGSSFEEVSKPESPVDSEPEDEEPVKPITPEPEETTTPEPVKSTTPPEPEKTVGGAIGRPTWAPISQSSPISLTTPGATGSAGIFAKITGSYKKGPADFQSELKDIDDQLRVLRAREFITTQKIVETEKEFKKDPTTNLPTDDDSENLRGRYIRAYNAYLKNKTLYDYNSKLISRIVDEKKEDVDERTLKEQYKEEFPDMAADFDNRLKKDDLFRVVRNNEGRLPENLKISKRRTKSGVAIDANSWWGLLNSKSTNNSASDPRKLGEYLNARENAYGEYTNSQDEMDKYKDRFEELDNSFKDLKSKLKDVQKQIKDLKDKRELILVDLSNYELPKGLFAEKAIPQKTTLPIGEERDQIIRSIKNTEKQIKEKQTEINDYISDNIEDDGKLRADSTAEYTNKKTEMETLKSSRDNLIKSLEGRTVEQKQLLQDNELETLIKELLASKLVDKNGVKTVLVNSSFPKVFAMYKELSSANMQTIHEKIDRYYNFFTKAKTVGFTAFNGQDVSNAFSFLFLYTTDKYNIPPELKNKIKEFLRKNRKLILDCLAILEFANEGINTPTEETRDIVEQALMSGQAPFAKALQRAVKNVDPSKYFGQTDKAKLERVIKDFRERIFNKTQVVYLKYGLWGKQAVSLIESIQGIYDEYKALLLAEFANFFTLTGRLIQDNVNNRQSNVKQSDIKLSNYKISELAKILLTFIDETDPLNVALMGVLTDISEPQPEFFRGGAKANNLFELQQKYNSVNYHFARPTKLVVKYEKLLTEQIKIFFEKMSTSLKELRTLTTAGNSSNIAVKREAEEIVRAIDAIQKIVDIYRKKTDKDSVEFIKRYDRDLSETYSDFKNEASDAARNAERGIIEYNEKDAKENDIILKKTGILLLNVIEGTGIIAGLTIFGILSAIKDFFGFIGSKSYVYAATIRSERPAEVVPEQEPPVVNAKPVVQPLREVSLVNRALINEKLEPVINLFETFNFSEDDIFKMTENELSEKFISIKNASQAINDLPETPETLKLKVKYSEILGVIDALAEELTIPTTGGLRGPIREQTATKLKLFYKNLSEIKLIFSDYTTAIVKGRIDPAELLKNKLEMQLLDLEDKNSQFENLLNDFGTTINTLREDSSLENSDLVVVARTNIIKYNNDNIVPLINLVNNMINEIPPELKANQSVAEELVKLANILSSATGNNKRLVELIETGANVYKTARNIRNAAVQPVLPKSNYSQLLSDANKYIKKYASDNNITLLTQEAVIPESAGSQYNLDVFPQFNDWTVLQTIGDGNCLTHAFLQSCSSEYRKLPVNIKEGLGIHFRKAFAKYSDLSLNKDLYNQNRATEWLTDREITDYSKLFNVITIIFDQPNTIISASFGNFIAGSVPPETPVIFIHASGTHYSSVQTPEKSTFKKFEDASGIPEFVQMLSNVSAGGNHRTRRHWVRSKPSRFTRHKIY
jgi:hypothetical protein